MKYQVLFPGGKKRAMTFSYDDGQIYDRQLVEMFNKYNVKATFHLNSATLGVKNGEDSFVDKEEVRTLYEGHEVSAHGYNHPYFAQLPQDQVVYQLYEDKRILENLCGYPVRGMSYPYGEFSDELVNTAKTLGLEYSRTVNDTLGVHIPHDFMRWNPSCHHNKVDKVYDEFMNCPSYRELMLFYIWGHSFEFHRENNWEDMEEFLKKVANQDDVWYATNIEIKDYISAYRSLKVTADQTAVYNVAATPVWIKFEDKLLIAEPGKLLEL